MVLLKISLALLALSAKIATAQYTQEDQEEQHRNARCVNQCVFDAWPEGYCVDDPACTCNEKDKREAYICCVAEKCKTGEWEESVERASSNCIAFGIPFTFDVKEACGFTPDSTSISSSAVESETATVTETSTATADATETATESSSTESTTSAAETNDAEETESASATTSPTESQTGEESEETSSPPNGAAGREVSWAGMAVLAAGAGMLL